MQNNYESPDAIQIGQAEVLILGVKWQGAFDIYTSCEASCVVDIFYDIDE